jgi:hypothetical protein
MKGTVSIDPDFGVFRTDALDELDAFFRAHGFAILRGLYSRDDLATMLAESRARARVMANRTKHDLTGEMLRQDGGSQLMQYITQSPTTRAAVLHPAIVGLMARWILAGICASIRALVLSIRMRGRMWRQATSALAGIVIGRAGRSLMSGRAPPSRSMSMGRARPMDFCASCREVIFGRRQRRITMRIMSRCLKARVLQVDTPARAALRHAVGL